jgi:signal transduction histidine kinase/DNA-binding response OmpR family regulator
MLLACQSNTNRRVLAQQGLMDLSEWDFGQGAVGLNGEWAFYWGSLINDTSQLHLPAAGYCRLPGYWTEEIVGQTPYRQNGVATYHLELLLPDTAQVYALKLNAVYTSYSLWANGQRFAQVGQVAADPAQAVPDFETRLVSLPRQRRIHLFLQVASWEHRRGGGSPDPILLGTERQIHDLWRYNLMGQLASVTIIAGFALYLFALYFFYPNIHSYCYIGMFALLGALRAACVDEMVIEYLFDGLPYFWNQRIRYIGFFSGIGFILLANHDLFKDFAWKPATYGAYLLFAFSASTLLMPFRWSTYLSPFFQVLCVGLVFSLFRTLARTIYARKDLVEAAILLAGGAVLFASMIHYLLYANNIIDGRLYHNAGYTAFVLAQVLVLSYKNKRTYNKAEKLSAELLEWNKTLEDKVLQRTREISEQKLVLEAQRDRISEQAQMLASVNKKLQELDNAKNRFFANISHELRTPLTLILGGIEKTKRMHLQADDELRLIEKHTNLLHALINQLLDITKLEEGKMVLQMAPQPLVGLLKGFFYSFASLAAEKQLHISFECNAEEAVGLADKGALEKMVYNLLSNAYKFTPPHGRISMSVETKPNALAISVRDTGIGILEKDLPHLFDRFYQVDASLNRNYEGTGIGLALVKELLDLYQGKIEVSSRVGEGTAFLLEIPVQYLEPHIMPAAGGLVERHAWRAEEEEGAARQEGPIVLLVEDHPDLLAFLSQELQGEYRILAAADGEEGMRLAQEHIPDLVISDVMMPYKNGYELCRQLKEGETTSHIPIILLTARTSQESKMQGLEAGADDYLGKPFSSQELRVRVHNLVNSRLMLREKYAQKQEILLYHPEEVVQNTADRTFMNRLLQELERNFANENYSIDQLAEALNVSVRQLNRKLNALTGLSANRMLQNFRLQKAKELLETSDFQVKEIGFTVGFSSAPYFSKCFKDQFGLSPGEYKRERASGQ